MPEVSATWERGKTDMEARKISSEITQKTTGALIFILLRAYFPLLWGSMLSSLRPLRLYT